MRLRHPLEIEAPAATGEDQAAPFAHEPLQESALLETEPPDLRQDQRLVAGAALEELLVEDDIEEPVPVLQVLSQPLERVEAVHLGLHLRPPGIDQGDLGPRRRRVEQVFVVAHEPLVADDRAVVVLRLRAGRSGVKGQGGPVMGDGLGGPHPPPPVVVLVDDEGPAAAGGVHEAAGQTHVGEVALGEGAGPLGGPLAVPDVVLPPGPQLPRQQAALVVGLQVVLVIPLGQQQPRPEAPAELDEDLVEGLLPLQRRPLGEEQFQAGLQLIRATGIGAQHVGHLLQVGHAEEPLDPGPAHVGDDLGRLGQRPVLDDAADAARLVH